MLFQHRSAVLHSHCGRSVCLIITAYLLSATDVIVAKMFSRFTLAFSRGEALLPLLADGQRNMTLYAVLSWETMSSYAAWISLRREIE